MSVPSERPALASASTVGAGAAAVPGVVNPWLRVAAGLIDFGLLTVAVVVVNRVTDDSLGWLTIFTSILIFVGYFGLLLSARGQTVGMMPFHLEVRDQASARNPDLGSSAVRGLVCWLEVGLCLVGVAGWLWFVKDPQGQAIHDKVAGTIVTVRR